MEEEITIKKREFEKFVQCLNALEELEELIDRSAFPGVDNIIEEAKEVLENNPDIKPKWYGRN